MKKENIILIGGEAGQGVAMTSKFLGTVFARLGYFAFNYRDYPSLIRGGHNFNVLKLATKPVFSHENEYDIIIALDEKTINLHKKGLKKGGFILASERLKGKNIVNIKTLSFLKKIGAPQIAENNILLGFLFKYFGIDLQFVLSEAGKFFSKKKDVVKKCIAYGYKLGEEKGKWPARKRGNYFLSGNEAVGVGAIASGIDAYIAYPMTPATPVLHFLAKRKRKYNYLVLQLENEIAVANAALGASFAGGKVMVGTSGGGFALMSETMSLAGMSEVPLVAFLSQRTSPSTGIPTYTTQGDLKFALNVGHGEFPRVLVAPGDPKEAILRTEEAFYLAAKYRMLSIIISDKHLGESDFTLEELEHFPPSRKRFLTNLPKTGFKNYKLTKSGLSPRAVPGEVSFARATSYEHDEYGFTIEEPKMAVKMNDKRFRKFEVLSREVKEKFSPLLTYGKGKKLLISWGSTKGAILDALSQMKNFKFLEVSYISPFPGEQLARELKKAEDVVLLENNVTGLLGDIIREKTGYLIKKKVLKYDGRPFTSKEVVNSLKNYGY